MCLFTGWILAILVGCVTSDCQEAFQCFNEFYSELSIDMRESNVMTTAAQTLDGVCQNIGGLMECYGSFASCNMYKQYISLPTSVQLSQGLRLLCDYKYKIALDCSEIGEFLTWLGEKMETKFISDDTKMAVENLFLAYTEATFDAVCKEKKTLVRYTADIVRCKIVQPYFNITDKGRLNTMYDTICNNKKVFIKAQECSQNSSEEIKMTVVPEYVACLTTYIKSLRSPNITSVDKICSVMGELMTCSPSIKHLMMCRKGIFDLLETHLGYKVPCSHILFSNQ